MLRIISIGFIIGFFGLQSKSQSVVKKAMDLEAYRHHMAFADHQISFYTLPVDKSAGKVKPERNYHWWGGRQLNITQGGYSGKLLHGEFNSFYLNKQLKEQGVFKKGLKIGKWKEWNENGKLSLLTNYRNGSANGIFYRYDTTGKLSEQGRYKNGKLHGKLKKYFNADSVAYTKYEDGRLLPKKGGKTWWQFWKKRAN